MKLGAHVSFTNPKKAIEEIISYGGNSIQVFISNPRSGITKARSNKDIDKINELINNNKINFSIHSPYVLNFSKEVDVNEQRFKTLIGELDFATKMDNCLGCVIHMGKSLKMDVDKAVSNYVESLKAICKHAKFDKYILVETCAGQGTEICRKLEDFADMYNSFTKKEKEKIGICIDTCHIFASGYDISSKKGIKDYLKKFDDLIGIEHFKLLHLNDSKKPCGSRVDRHEQIGFGHIYKEDKSGLAYLVNFCKKQNIPMILETTNTSDYTHKEEIELINKLI